MSIETAFVGDVHGNLSALKALHTILAARGTTRTVFLGDYINKGRQSAEVIEELLDYSKSGRVTLLRGNHEAALLDAIDTGDLAPFLKMGGAMTIRSYVGGKVGPDVLSNFRDKFPQRHLEVMRRMRQTYESNDVIAQHMPFTEATSKFRISSHVPIGELPRIGKHSARLDTGSGTQSGRLTALLWPSLDYIQVDARGTTVSG